MHEIAKVLAIFPEPFEANLFSNTSLGFALDNLFHYLEIGSMLDEVSSDADLVLATSTRSSLEFINRRSCVGVACAVDRQRQYYDSLGQLGVVAQIGSRTPSLG